MVVRRSGSLTKYHIYIVTECKTEHIGVDMHF